MPAIDRSLSDCRYVGGSDTAYVSVTAVWGVDNVDRKDLNRWTPSNRGDAIFDDSFDLSSTAAQDHIAATCAALRVEPCAYGERISCADIDNENCVTACQDGTGQLVRPNESGDCEATGDCEETVLCFIEAWQTWYLGTQCPRCSDDPERNLPASCATVIGQSGVTCETDLATVGLTDYAGTPLSSICRESCGQCDAAATSATTACEDAIIDGKTFPKESDFLPSITVFRNDPVHFRKYKEHIGIIGDALKYVFDAVCFVYTCR